MSCYEWEYIDTPVGARVNDEGAHLLVQILGELDFVFAAQPPTRCRRGTP